MGVEQQTTIKVDAFTRENKIGKRVARRSDLISIRFIITVKNENAPTKQIEIDGYF